MAISWKRVREFVSRIRSVNTPFGGVSWESPASISSHPTSTHSPLSPRGAEREEWSHNIEPDEERVDEFEWEETYDDILCEIAESYTRGLSVRQICNRFGLSAIRAQHYLEMLAELGLVERSDGYYFLSPTGRKYLVEADLVE